MELSQGKSNHRMPEPLLARLSDVDRALSRRHRQLPDPLLEPTVDVERAAVLLGIGRTSAYELAKTGRFPVPLLMCGHRYRVPTAPLLDALGLRGRAGQ